MPWSRSTGNMQDGVFWYGVRVNAANTVDGVLCNLSGAALTAITESSRCGSAPSNTAALLLGSSVTRATGAHPRSQEKACLDVSPVRAASR